MFQMMTCVTSWIASRRRLFREVYKRHFLADAVCAVDSTSISAYGSSLADIKLGKNIEGISLPQTSEVVVCSLDDHLPVYYMTFPGNIPDSSR